MSQTNTLSEATLKRNFSLGKDLSETNIGEINAILDKGRANITTQDFRDLKQIFGKPRNFKNNTILAYARNVKQYNTRLSNPNPQIKGFVQQQYGIGLTDSYSRNLELMGNAQPRRRGGTPQRLRWEEALISIYRQPIQPIPSVNGVKIDLPANSNQDVVNFIDPISQTLFNTPIRNEFRGIRVFIQTRITHNTFDWKSTKVLPNTPTSQDSIMDSIIKWSNQSNQNNLYTWEIFDGYNRIPQSSTFGKVVKVVVEYYR